MLFFYLNNRYVIQLLSPPKSEDIIDLTEDGPASVEATPEPCLAVEQDVIEVRSDRSTPTGAVLEAGVRPGEILELMDDGSWRVIS